jgi:uncharacterized membrane protein YraQ (UPF0718 family)
MFYIAAIIALTISFFANKKRTIKGIKIGFKKLTKMTPIFMTMLMIVAIVLFLVPNEAISTVLGSKNLFTGTVIAALVGSLTMMPGPIVYPLCGILKEQGVSYTVISAFSISLMMVGVVTFPLEKSYFGLKFTIVRNIVSFVIALIVAVIIGLWFGEIV